MRRMKQAIAAGGAVLVLLGVVGSVTIWSDDGLNRSPTVAAREAPGETTSDGVAPTLSSAATPTIKESGAPPTTQQPSKAPARATTTPSVPRTPQEVQQFVAGMTAHLQVSTATDGSTAPVTKEQVEAQVRLQLQQLGIHP